MHPFYFKGAQTSYVDKRLHLGCFVAARPLPSRPLLSRRASSSLLSGASFSWTAISNVFAGREILDSQRGPNSRAYTLGVLLVEVESQIAEDPLINSSVE